MSDDFSTAKTETEVPLLDGAWLRRERERIAIGRRQVASRLGLPDSQVIRVEMNKLPVPAEWFTALSELGFPVPKAKLATDTATAAPTIGEARAPAAYADVPPAAAPPSVREETAPPPASSPIAASPSQFARTEPPTAQPVPEPAPTPEPVVATAPPPTIPASAAPLDAPGHAMHVAQSPVIASPAAPPSISPIETPASGTLLRGLWLRAQRQAREVSPLQISQVLGIPKNSLLRFETSDMVVPPSWLPKLVALRLLDGETDGTRSLSSLASRYTGRWLRRERKQRGMTYIAIAPALRVAPSLLAVTETCDWPLPPEWLPALQDLGLPVLAASASSAQPDAAPQNPKRGAAKVVSAPPAKAQGPIPNPASAVVPNTSARQHDHADRVDGAWLKAQRKRLGLSVRAVRLHLHVAAKTYLRFEGSRGLLPRFWWPGLRKLGMNLPSAPPVPSTPSQPVTGPRDGAWLARERRQLRLTEYEVCRVVQANARMLRRIERESAELPRAWLAKLPLLGIAVDVATAQRRPARKTSRPTKTVPNTPPTSGQKPAIPASPSARETVKSAPAATAASQGADLVALVVNFRLTLGQHTKQPPFEILSRILSDLREADVDQALTHEDVERAARALIRKR